MKIIDGYFYDNERDRGGRGIEEGRKKEKEEMKLHKK